KAAHGEVVARREALEQAAETCTAAVARARTAHDEAVTALAESRTRHAQLEEDVAECTRRLTRALDEHADRCPCGSLWPAQLAETPREGESPDDSTAV